MTLDRLVCIWSALGLEDLRKQTGRDILAALELGR